MLLRKQFQQSLYKFVKLSLKSGQEFRYVSTQPQVCIVGSGPAGFVLAQTLLKNNSSFKVDMFEKRPIPFGLIRYGVSPDHQDVKNCINGYTKTAESDRFSFFGNVEVGNDVTLTELCGAYHAVVLCTGAQAELKLGVPGEHLHNVLTSNQFVGWYNGVPEYQNLDFDLSGKTAVIVGVGNVALDVARLLFKSTEELQETDITNEALDKLSRSNITNIHIIGRRGPLQMACTRKELAEITDMPDVVTYVDSEHFSEAVEKALNVKDLKLRKYQRLVKYLQKKAVEKETHTLTKNFFVKFLRSPAHIMTKNGKSVSAISLRKREIAGDDAFNPTITDTEVFEKIQCDLIISCIGFANTPFTSDMICYKNGKIVQNKGQISLEKGLYTCGWCSHGPKGVLADSGNDSLLTGTTILSDLPSLLSNKCDCHGSDVILDILKRKNVQLVEWKDWEKIDQTEISEGEKVGKIREKVLTHEEMLILASS